jgi:nicotinate-nucleotide adenylyltransferase
MPDNKELKKIIFWRLSERRFNHSLAVAECASKLAELNGADKEKAFTAGLLHDICKEQKKEEQKELLIKSGYADKFGLLESPSLWHGFAGAYYCETELGIDDSEILDAVRWHTTGKPAMTMLEKCLFVGDAVSEDRRYSDIESLRKAAFSDLDGSIPDLCKSTINAILQKNLKLSILSVETYNYYLPPQKYKN